MEDRATAAYFDDFTPEYYVERYERAIEIINEHCPPGASLIDLGCGTGNVLQFIKSKTRVERLVGMDVSKNCLARVTEKLQCETIIGSILDDGLLASIGERFDFVIMGALLHHLVGSTRRKSRKRAKHALANAMLLLKDRGHLFIIEPAFSPSFLMDVVFYVKSFVGKISRNRVELFSEWANIGLPVVSYYTNQELVDFIKHTPGAELMEEHIRNTRRLGFIIRRTQATLVARRAPGGAGGPEERSASQAPRRTGLKSTDR